MPGIQLIDNGLIGRTGHHFDFSHGLAKRLLRDGAQVLVVGPRSARPEVASAFARDGIAFRPHFSRAADEAFSLEGDPGQRWEGILRQMAEEVQQLPPAELCIFPTLTPDLFAAYTLGTEPAPMAGLVHQEPYAGNPFGGQVWNQSCGRVLARGMRVVLGAIDPMLRDVMKGFCGTLPIHDMPIPLRGDPRRDYPVRPRRIGFFGHQRAERGLPLLSALAGRLLDLGYEVVLHDSKGQFRAGQPHPRLHLLDAFVDDLAPELRSCDLVVCPMDRVRYALRMSGIALHSVACGVPFVVPAGTLPCLRFLASGCCAPYFDPSVAGIVEAVQGMAGNYPAHARAAAEAAQDWHRRNGEEAFLRFVLDHPLLRG